MIYGTKLLNFLASHAITKNQRLAVQLYKEVLILPLKCISFYKRQNAEMQEFIFFQPPIQNCATKKYDSILHYNNMTRRSKLQILV